MAINDESADSGRIDTIIDRQAALLTRRQREILLRDELRGLLSQEELEERGLTEEGISNAVVRNREKDARDRVLNAVLDMNIVNGSFSPGDYYRIQKQVESDEMILDGWVRGEQALAEFLYSITGVDRISEIIGSAIVNVESTRAQYLVDSVDNDLYPFDIEFDISTEVTFKLEDRELELDELIAKKEDDSEELDETEKLILDSFWRLHQSSDTVEE